jgi:predicted nucleic acid-binding protein
MADISLLLDTDVLIEFFRGRPQAAEWLAGHGRSVIGIPVIVWMELLQGARDRIEQQRIASAAAAIAPAWLSMTLLTVSKPRAKRKGQRQKP